MKSGQFHETRVAETRPELRSSPMWIAAVQPWVAKISNLAASEVQLFRRLAPNAVGPFEGLSLFFFVVRHALARVSRYHVPCGDVRVILRGRRYTVGLISGELEVMREIYRERIYDRRRDFVAHPGWTVFDVGANIGLFSILQATRGARVYAFEPNLDCYRRLVRNARENPPLDSISAYNLALGRADGQALLRVPWNRTHSGSLAGCQDGDDSVDLVVSVTSLDHLIGELRVPHIDLLKIDVEGWEIDVLQGAADALVRTDRVIVEYHSLALREQLYEAMQDRGFVPVEDILCYPPDVGVLYARRATSSSGEGEGTLLVQPLNLP